MPSRFTFVIRADHPSLAGHFPGAPVVAGVIVLERVLAHVAWPAGEPRRLAWVKFLRPLLPEQVATVTVSENAAGWRFTVSREEEILVQGMLATAGGERQVAT